MGKSKLRTCYKCKKLFSKGAGGLCPKCIGEAYLEAIKNKDENTLE